MKFLNSMLQLGLITFLGFQAQAQNIRDIQVLGVTYQGSGCPQGSVNTVFSPDVSAFSILYDQFVMDVGGQTQETTDTKSCEVQIRVKLPFGTALNVESADFRGFVSLDGGVFAQHEVQHQIGSNKLASFGFGSQLFQGPVQKNYLIQSQKPNFKLSKLLRCLPLKREVTLSVRTRIKMTGGEGARLGLMSVDSADGKIEQKYLVSLTRCI